MKAHNEILGNVTHISIGTNDLEASLEAYQLLGFRKVGGDSQPYPWAYVSDRSLLIQLNQDNMQYMGLTYFGKQHDITLETLAKEGIKPVQQSQHEGTAQQSIISSPDQFYISLIHQEYAALPTLDLPTYRNFPQEDLRSPDKLPNPNCGIFGEFCHPVKELGISLAFWKKLGFEVMSVNEKPYPWAILQDGSHTVGLHQTEDFHAPAITYFATDMASRLKVLKAKGLTGLEDWKGEGGAAGNAVWKTPEGQQFFLFSF